MSSILRKLRRWSSRTKLLAISDDELEAWLASLGILEAFQAGEVACFVCEDQINLDTLQLVSSVQGKIVVCCPKPDCISAFAQLGREENT